MPIPKQKGTRQISYRGCCLGCYKDTEEGDKVYWWFKEMAEKEGWDLETTKEKAEKVKRGVPLDEDFMTVFEVADYLNTTINVIHQTDQILTEKYVYRRRNKNRDLSFNAREIKNLRNDIDFLKKECKLIEEEGVKPIYYINKNGDIFSFNGSIFPKKMNYTPNQDGYPQVYLCYTKEYKEATGKQHGRFAVHRLVAKYFIPNPHNYESINHKDGNKENFSISNLEWCSMEYNRLHALRNGLFVSSVAEKRSGKRGVIYRSKQRRKWEVYFRGKILGRFENLEEAIKVREEKELEVYGFIIPKYSIEESPQGEIIPNENPESDGMENQNNTEFASEEKSEVKIEKIFEV